MLFTFCLKHLSNHESLLEGEVGAIANISREQGT